MRKDYENVISERKMLSNLHVQLTKFQIQDLTILEEVLRMVLEIINSCLTHRLAHNPNLIYTLLYKKDIFQPFRMHSAFQDIVQNIDSVSVLPEDVL